MYEYACHEGNYSMVMLGGRGIKELTEAGLR